MDQATPPPKLIEIRTYRVKPGSGPRFVAAMADALPMVRASGMDVVAFGRSDHEHESFHLIRAYADRAQLIAQQDAFYGSDAWRLGPRQALIDCLEDYLNTLLWLSADAVENLRSSNGAEIRFPA
ncbi:NIPSNAP family protein [Pseudomonas sp. CGJS7]|uniref:NIPSNAP family protein n=1 Tax=Pseudomonas sp. CGJS7 TaxID=3109348 RepID=UPI00300A6510